MTYVQTTTLPYDAYVGSNDATATLEVDFTNSETTQNFSAQNAPLLPVSFVSKSSGQEWVLPGVETMTIGGSAFELPSDPLLLEVTSGSSSAAGLFGSPTMLRNSFDLAGFDSEKVDAIMQCAPSGMQSTATPVLEPPICVEPSCSPFRYVDGAFVENTALAATVAQVQRDCAAGLADCTSATPKLILLNDGSVGTAFLGNHARLLFSSSEFPEYTTPGNYRPPSIDYPGSAPVVTIFEEEFPDDSEFTEYATFNWTMTDEEVMAFCKHLVFPFIDVVNQHKELKEEAVSSIANAVCAHKKGPAKSVCVTTAKTTISVTMSSESLVCTALQNGPAASKIGTTYTSSSVYWQGTVTTIENEFMTVTGGQQFAAAAHAAGPWHRRDHLARGQSERRVQPRVRSDGRAPGRGIGGRVPGLPWVISPLCPLRVSLTHSHTVSLPGGQGERSCLGHGEELSNQLLGLLGSEVSGICAATGAARERSLAADAQTAL